MEFKVQHLGKKVRLAIIGALDANTSPEIRGAIDGIVETEPEEVEVDLSSLDLIDSTGIGAIVSFFKRTRAYGGQFKVFGLKGQPRSIFRLLRLDRLLVARAEG